jgi:hypothetical protein
LSYTQYRYLGLLVILITHKNTLQPWSPYPTYTAIVLDSSQALDIHLRNQERVTFSYLENIALT